MKYWPLVWSTLRRKKLRTIFTLLSIVVAFLLFGLLAAVKQAFNAGIEIAGKDRLVVIHKVNIIQPLPEAYGDRIAAVPHVTEATHANWFGGIYQKPANFFPQMAVEPEKYLHIYPEFQLPEDQKKAWFEDRAGAIVGSITAKRYGFKVGDKVPIQGTIYRKKDGTSLWEFNIDGIYESAKNATADTTQFLFNYKRLEEAVVRNRGMVGWYIIRVDAPDQAAQIAKAIDNVFENSEYETKTTTEKAFQADFAKQMGNIGAIIQGVVTVVFFTLLLVVGNTMMQTVRERTTELAVLKTVGFTGGRLLALVLVQSFLVAALGGGAGLTIAWLVVKRGDPTGGFLPIFYFPTSDLIAGIGFVVALGLVTGIVPAMQAMNLRVVDALRRT